MTRPRSALLPAGLSLAAAFVLAMPLAAQAGGHGCNCGAHPSTGHAVSIAHASARASATVHVSAQASGRASAYSHAGGYAVHTGGYNNGGYSHQAHYPPHVIHYPTRYPNQGGYNDHSYDNHGGGYAHNDHGGRYEQHGYDRFHRAVGNSLTFAYAPTYGDGGYAGDYGGGYAAAPAVSSSAPASDYDGDYASAGYDDSYAPPADDNYAYDNGGYQGSYGDTRYDDASYGDTSYSDSSYAPPPPPPADYGYSSGYSDTTTVLATQGWRDNGGAWHCGAPVVQGGAPQGGAVVTAYGWRDQYGEWHVTRETSHYSYSYSY